MTNNATSEFLSHEQHPEFNLYGQFSKGFLTVVLMQNLFFQLEEIKNNPANVIGKIDHIKQAKQPPGNKAFAEDPIDIQRKQKVKDAMIHAWSSYEKYAWGQDELQVSLSE